MQQWVRDLNHLYRAEAALHETDFDPAGFEWIDCNDASQSTLSLIRKARSGPSAVMVLANFTPVPRLGYRVGAPWGGSWIELLNSDSEIYGGSGVGNLGGVAAEAAPLHGRPFSLNLTLPPLGIVFLKSEPKSP